MEQRSGSLVTWTHVIYGLHAFSLLTGVDAFLHRFPVWLEWAVHRRGSLEFSPPLNEAIVRYFSLEFHGFLSSMGSRCHKSLYANRLRDTSPSSCLLLR